MITSVTDKRKDQKLSEEALLEGKLESKSKSDSKLKQKHISKSVSRIYGRLFTFAIVEYIIWDCRTSLFWFGELPEGLRVRNDINFKIQNIIPIYVSILFKQLNSLKKHWNLEQCIGSLVFLYNLRIYFSTTLDVLAVYYAKVSYIFSYWTAQKHTFTNTFLLH